MSTDTMNLPLPPQQGDVAPVKKELTFGESINFNGIFRVKGKKNLWISLTAPQKNGMCGMIEMGVNNPVSVHKKNVECLGAFVFHKADGTTIRMGQVFDNLEKFTLEELGVKKDIELMEIMCPNYHPDMFKPYHGEKVISWYFEIKEKINRTLIPKE